MSRRFVGVVLLLAGSLALGMLTGQLFFRIYEETVPPALTTRFNVSSAHAYFLWRGLLFGFLYFAWALVAVGVARLFRRRGTADGTVPGTADRPLGEADRRD